MKEIEEINFKLNYFNVLPSQNYIYVLELEYNNYYVGRSSHIKKRLYDHFNFKGAQFTKKFKPIKIIEIIEETDVLDEKYKTLEIMEEYGWENVRGYAWSQVILKYPPIQLYISSNKILNSEIDSSKNYETNYEIDSSKNSETNYEIDSSKNSETKENFIFPSKFRIKNHKKNIRNKKYLKLYLKDHIKRYGNFC